MHYHFMFLNNLKIISLRIHGGKYHDLQYFWVMNKGFVIRIRNLPLQWNFFSFFGCRHFNMARHHPRLQAEPLLDVSVTSSFGSPIMFNPKRGIEASAGVLKDIILGNEVSDMSNNNRYDIQYFIFYKLNFWLLSQKFPIFIE